MDSVNGPAKVTDVRLRNQGRILLDSPTTKWQFEWIEFIMCDRGIIEKDYVYIVVNQ